MKSSTLAFFKLGRFQSYQKLLDLWWNYAKYVGGYVNNRMWFLFWQFFDTVYVPTQILLQKNQFHFVILGIIKVSNLSNDDCSNTKKCLKCLPTNKINFFLKK